MNSVPALRAVVTAAVIAALAPSTAVASTWTVDDDKADCPNAAFTSIQAAIDQAAPWDTVVVCPGLYLEQSTPTSGNNSPSQAGSRNGLTITKPLTLRGAGASKVTIRPAPAVGETLAGSAPYLRDGGGNVVTVARQSLGATDDNENFVDISGVTIESGDVAAEAGIAFFNTSGRIANSVIGAIKPAGPHGLGVVMSNSLQGAEAGVRRQLTLEKSLVGSGGVLFDDARGADGTATTTVRSGITAYGNLVGSRVAGPVTYTYGQRGSITGSEITGALTLTDAETGPDPSNPALRAFSVGASSLASLANSGPGTALAAGNWWGCAAAGCATTSGPVDLAGALTAAPAPLSVPAPTLDAAPTATIVDPVGPTVVPYGETIYPVVVAGDDFGVKSVALTANGAAGRDAQPRAVRVRVHARLRAHRRRRDAHGHDHGLLRPVEHGLDRDLGARDHDRDARHRQRLGPADARAHARRARELRRLHARHRRGSTPPRRARTSSRRPATRS